MDKVTNREHRRSRLMSGLAEFTGRLGKFALLGLALAVALASLFALVSANVLNNTWAGQERDFQFWLHSFASLPLDLLFGFASVIGGGEGTFVLAGILMVFLLLKRQFGWAVLLFFTQVGGILLNTLFKEFFQRTRPDLWELTQGLRKPLSYSFPSAHATMSMCFFGLLIYLGYHFFKRRVWRWVWASLMAALIGLVGLSRIYFGVHYPTDILGGYILGGFWLLSLIAGTNLQINKRGVDTDKL